MIIKSKCWLRLSAVIAILMILALACSAPPGITSRAPTTSQQGISTTLPSQTPEQGRLLETLSKPVRVRPQASQALVFVNGFLIDGSGARPLEDAVLVIQDGRITALGRSSAVEIPQQSTIIDVQGGTILPGFINAHVHNAYNLEKLAAWAQEGVTTVRDLNATASPAPLAIRAQASQDPRYARLVAAGVMLTAPGGYPIAVFGAQGLEISTPEEARQGVNDLLDQGAEVIKIALESGEIFGESIPMLSEQQVAAIVQTAHQRGVPVSAHVTVSKDLKLAIEAGVDDIAHMVTDPVPDDLIERMVSGGVSWTPTIELWKNVQRGMDRYVLDNLRHYVLAGGKVALGTDYAGYYTPFQLGMPMHEIEWMQEAGMTPMQILIAGTREAASVCGLQDELGTLEVNKIADLFVIQGDPLQDIHTLLNVRWVVHNGALIRSPD